MENRRPPQPETHHDAFERIVGQAIQNVRTMTKIGDETDQLYLEAARGMPILREEWGKKRFTGSLELIVYDRIVRQDSEALEAKV